MLIDLHTHTYPCSPCSIMSAEELIERAKKLGLDAICVTDHLYIEGAEYAQNLGKKEGLLVLRGVEARTLLGDLLVFGCYRDFPEGIPGEEVCRIADEAGGVVIPAHPFRVGGGWALHRYLSETGLELAEGLGQIPALQGFTAVEVLNSQCTVKENQDAQRLAEILGLPGVGGSDAHSVERVGMCVTHFSDRIQSDEQLVMALKSGEYRPLDRRITMQSSTVTDSTPVGAAGHAQYPAE